MSNYKETDVAGKSWQRAKSFYGENGLGGTPAITFHEEEVINLSDGKILKENLGNLVEPLTEENQGEVFPVQNPLTGEYVRDATYGELHMLIHSAYYHKAGKRDAEEAARLAEQEAAAAEPEPESDPTE